MKFAVVGGDNRSAQLCALLSEDGHRVHSFGLEKTSLPPEILKTGCLQGCIYGADCVVLPTPAERAGLLNAPYATESCTVEEVISAMWPGQLLFAGALSRDSSLKAINAGLNLEDAMRRRGFAVGNAAITAEGAVELLMKNSPRTLWRSRALVIGWGRVGKILAWRLAALGAKVTVAARKEADRAMALALGLDAMEMRSLETAAEGFAFITNTVPAQVLSEKALRRIAQGAVLLELASPPGGFDMALAEKLGVIAVAAPGLPGLCAPYTAAELMRELIYAALKEQEELNE